MAAATTFVSPSSVAGGASIRACNANRELQLHSSAHLGISSPSAAHLRASFLPPRTTIRLSQLAFQVNCKTLASDATVLDKEGEGGVERETPSPTPSALLVQSLLEEICDETKIAEVKLKVGDFLLHVKRDVGKAAAAAAPPPPAPAPSTQSSVEPSPPAVVNGSPSPSPPAKSNSVANSNLPATISKTASLFGLLEAAADQGLSFVTSPKVGVFRRGRNVKGKIGRPLVAEGLNVLEGQVVGYVEQLGTQQPVEAEVSGEVMQVLWEDGESVGYGDPLISIRPSFPGIVSRTALN